MMRSYIYIMCMVVMCLLSACDPYTPLCSTEPPHRSNIKFEWAWGQDQNKPDSMSVLALRRVNDLRYQLLASTKTGLGVMVRPEKEITEIGTRKQMRLRPGTYEFLAFNGDTEAYDDNHERFFNLDSEEPEAANPFDDIRFTYRIFPNVLSSTRLRQFKDWEDANPYSGYILSPAKDVFLSRVTTTLDQDVNENNKTVTIHMPMQRLVTQVINIDFSIASKEEGVFIDSVFAELSGICTSVRLGDSSVDVEKTAKVLFRPSVTVTDEEQKNFTCSGKFSCLGLVGAVEEKSISGPGVLQVNIFARCIYTVKVPGVHSGEEIEVPYTVRKNFRASIGLFKTISANPALRYNSSIKGFVQTSPNMHYSISVPLTITREEVLKGDNVAHDNWHPEPTIIYLDI